MASSEPDRGALWRPVIVGPLLVATAAALSWWLADRGVPPNDEGALLANAGRLLRGAVYYRDIDAYPFPGATYLLAFAMRLFGEHLSVARALAGLFFCATVAALYVASLALLDRRRAALFGISLLSLKFVAWPAFTSYIYSDVAFAFACLTVAAMASRSSERGLARLFVAGLGIGGAVVAKQSLGIAVAGAVGALLLFPGFFGGAASAGLSSRARQLVPVAAGALVWLAPMLGYFAFHGLLDELIASGLVAPFTRYLPASSLSFSTPLRWWELGQLRGMPSFPYFVAPLWVMLTRGELPGTDLNWLLGEITSRVVYTSLPLVFGWVVWRWIRSAAAAADAKTVSVREFALLAGAIVLSAFPRADFYHVISVYPVAWLLGFAMASPRTPGSWRWRTEAAAIGLLVLGSLLLMRHYDEQLDARLVHPRANLAIESDAMWIEAIVRAIESEVPPDAPVFVYGNEAYYYFLSNRYYDAWPFAQLYPGQTGADRGGRLAEVLRRSPPALVVRGVIEWPGLPSISTYAPELDRSLRRHFALDAGFFASHPPKAGRPPARSFAAVLRPRRR